MSSSLFAIDNRTVKTRDDLVADALRTAILRGAFKPGERLDQQQLSGDLGVSRSPVREALRTLAAEGLVTIIPNRGTVVAQRSLEELGELLYIRRMLEGAAARRAAQEMDDRRLDKLSGLLEQASDISDPERILALNNDFHTTIYTAFAQPVLIQHINQLRNKVAPYNRLYLEDQDNKEAAWAGHRLIFEACARRNGYQAEAETKRHLEQVYQRIVEKNQVSLTESSVNIAAPKP